MGVRRFVKICTVSEGLDSDIILESYEIYYNPEGTEFVRVVDLKSFQNGIPGIWFIRVKDLWE